MDTRADRLSEPAGGERASERFVSSPPAPPSPSSADAEDIAQTRAEMSETIEAIQERLAPERLTDVAEDVTDQAKDAALEAVDHAVQEVKTTAQEWGELASVAALEAVDHAIEEVKAAFPEMSDQAKEAAVATIDHAVEEAKAAMRELGAQTSAAVRDATIGRVERMVQETGSTTKRLSSSVMTTIKQNPGSAALAGLGLGWLVMSGRNAQRQPTASRGGYPTEGVEDQARQTAGQLAGQAQEKADQVQATAGDLINQTQDAAASVVGQTQETASAVADQTKQTMGQLADQTQQIPRRMRSIFEENPFAVGGVAVALGGAAALLIPETQRENELMGEARENLIDRAQASAQDVVQKVQRVTEEAGEAAAKEAKYQGLSPES